MRTIEIEGNGERCCVQCRKIINTEEGSATVIIGKIVYNFCNTHAPEIMITVCKALAKGAFGVGENKIRKYLYSKN